MGNQAEWGPIVTLIAAAAAIAAACICWWIWRNVRGAIHAGDKSVKDHADKSIDEMKQRISGMHRTLADVSHKTTAISTTVATIAEVQAERQEQMESVRQDIARIETHQEHEERHVLRPRDLGAIHERINRLAETQAAASAKSTAENLGLGEQLKVLQRLVQDNLALRRSERP